GRPIEAAGTRPSAMRTRGRNPGGEGRGTARISPRIDLGPFHRIIFGYAQPRHDGWRSGDAPARRRPSPNTRSELSRLGPIPGPPLPEDATPGRLPRS